MRPIITEELRLRKRICEFAIKYGNNAEAARRYHTSRQQVQRWLKRYDGTLDSSLNSPCSKISFITHHLAIFINLLQLFSFFSCCFFNPASQIIISIVLRIVIQTITNRVKIRRCIIIIVSNNSM